MVKRCPYCGTELLERGGVSICPNHGVIEEVSELPRKDDDPLPSYLG